MQTYSKFFVEGLLTLSHSPCYCKGYHPLSSISHGHTTACCLYDQLLWETAGRGVTVE